MKKLFIGLMALALAFTAAVSLTGCGPTAGLDELTLDEITAADMSGTYSAVRTTTTYTYDSEGKQTSSAETTNLGDKSAVQVKVAMTTAAATIGLTSTLTHNANGRVCANSKFTKIVIYAYTNDSNGRRTFSTVTTYKKY